jgi:hypothetical protein
VPLISLLFPKKTAGGQMIAVESLTFWRGGAQITARVLADIRCYSAVIRGKSIQKSLVHNSAPTQPLPPAVIVWLAKVII